MEILFSPCHYIFDENSEGGEVSWTYNIAHRIASKYQGSKVVTGYKIDTQSKKKYEIIELQPKKKKIDISIWNTLKFNLKYFRATNQQIQRQRFDIVHHVLPFGIDSTFNLFFILNKTKNIPFIIGPIQNPLPYKDTDVNRSDIRSFKKKNKLDLNFNKYIQLLSKPVLKFLSNKTLHKASKIVVINQYTKKLLLNKDILTEKIEVIPPGIDTKRFKYVPFEEKKSDIIEIITVSYLIKRKGIDLIIRAIKKVVQQFKNIRLRVVGDGFQMESLKKLVKELNLKNYIIFEGYVPNNEIQKYYQKSHIFVSMSRAESWGQMYLEAMACGLPIITTRNVGSDEIIKDGEFGYLVEQGDYEALARKIIYLIENKHSISEFGRKSRKEAEEKYDWDRVIIPKYLEIYKEVLKNGK